MSDSENSEEEIILKKKPSKTASTIEKTYQKKSQLEHILLRPDTYIGSVEHAQELMWVFDSTRKCMIQRQINYVPGLYKIFDEILVNAADNKQRDKNMNCIRINIDAENNTVSVWNNGKGIPVVMHKDENMYVPTMIFGHLLTSSNYDDDEEKVVGGRNGYGAKLCNIFSVKFIVETASSEYKQHFKQVWENNMAKTSEPKLKAFSGQDFTKITFCPDLKKFGMERLDEDIVDLMSRRAYDIAASTRGVAVMLNDDKINVKSFRDYVELYVKNETIQGDNKLAVVHQVVNDRWEIAVTISERGFQQVSFVNSIATTKGGRHVDYVSDLIVKQLIELIKKKNKAGITIKPFQIKNHIWVFVNCLIVNPAFDSQTKENMTTQAKKFGSKCDIPEKFIQTFSKSGIIEIVLTWAKFKAQNELAKVSGKKTSKLNGVPKLEDANEAGTKNSHKCTLILTEGDSAKCLAVSGLGIVGRDYYGVFPLRGKLLNVREATHKQILENAEINNLIKILGLQHKKKYQTIDDLKTLRYGKVMIMTDQDPDGSHIKGLIINFIHHFWPGLLGLNFLEIFITPIVKVIKKNKEISFYSLQEFEEWKTEIENIHTYHIKYYKGLGTSTSKEAKEYFKDMERHRILLHYTGREDDQNILLAFSKKEIEGRKDWLLRHNEEVKRRKELGLSDVYLYTKNTRVVSFTEYVNKELVYFSNGDNVRSIPSMIDGLKPGQRKVLFTCFKRNDKREVKVAQLAGSVAEQSAYHHGEVSLCMTIVNLAQNFVGSNNINLLEPRGQFGTRLNGGKDSASPRYIFTKLSPLARLIFHPHDDPILKYEIDDNQRVEPTWYIPILPMVLVNGSDGIGTGWRTKVPNYNPREIVENIRLLLNDQEPMIMKPWYKNFKGTIADCTEQRYVINGEISITDEDEVEITELPVSTWTQVYKENVLMPMLQGSEKQRAVLHDYKEYSTDTTVKFVVKTLPGLLPDMEKQGLHYVFKLQQIFYTSSMNLFDEFGGMKKFESAEEILKDFYNIRLKMYVKRKDYLENNLEAESQRLTFQAKFIVEKCSGAIQVENKKRQTMIQELIKRGYPVDPVKAWKERNARENNEDVEVQEEAPEEEEAETIKDSVESGKRADKNSENDFKNSSDVQKYDYLLGMSMWMLTLEKKNQLLKQRDDKLTELEILRGKKSSDLWIDDLDIFLKKLDEIEEKERKEEAETLKKVAVKNKTVNKGRKNIVIKETMPSPVGKRIVPRLSMHIVNATKAKENKIKKINKEKEKIKSNQLNDGDESVEEINPTKKTRKPKLPDSKSSIVSNTNKDEFDLMIDKNKSTLKEKLENSLIKVAKKTAGRGRKKKNDDGLIQSQLNFSKSPTTSNSSKTKPKSVKSEKENIVAIESSDYSDIEMKESTPKRNARKLTNKDKNVFKDDKIFDINSDEELFVESDEAPFKTKKKYFIDSDDSEDEFIPPKKIRK